MPIALIVLVLDITLVYHSVRTGRARPWAFIILAVPFLGSVAYICFELAPEWFSSPEAKQARKRFADRIDPEKTYRELSDRLAVSDTVANRASLAAECARIARFDEAERHYEHIMTLPMGDDPKYALGRRKLSSWASGRPMRWQRWTICKNTGPIFTPPRATCSTRARWPSLGGPMRRWKNIMPFRLIFLAPRPPSAMDCCSMRLDGGRRPGWCSTSF
jgi:hypothetical protein